MSTGAIADFLSKSRITQSLLSVVSPGDVILIGGLARSGKSTLAAIMACQLEAAHKPAEIVSVDRWIVTAAERSKPGVESRYDLAKMVDALQPWLSAWRNLVVELPRYDRITRTRTEDADLLNLAGDTILILEGVVALLTNIETTTRKVHRVYVEANEVARKERVVGDLIERGVAGPAQARAIYEERQLDEWPVVQSSRATADYVVSSDLEI